MNNFSCENLSIELELSTPDVKKLRVLQLIQSDSHENFLILKTSGTRYHSKKLLDLVLER